MTVVKTAGQYDRATLTDWQGMSTSRICPIVLTCCLYDFHCQSAWPTPQPHDHRQVQVSRSSSRDYVHLDVFLAEPVSDVEKLCILYKWWLHCMLSRCAARHVWRSMHTHTGTYWHMWCTYKLFAVNVAWSVMPNNSNSEVEWWCAVQCRLLVVNEPCKTVPGRHAPCIMPGGGLRFCVRSCQHYTTTSAFAELLKYTCMHVTWYRTAEQYWYLLTHSDVHQLSLRLSIAGMNNRPLVDGIITFRRRCHLNCTADPSWLYCWVAHACIVYIIHWTWLAFHQAAHEQPICVNFLELPWSKSMTLPTPCKQEGWVCYAPMLLTCSVTSTMTACPWEMSVRVRE